MRFFTLLLIYLVAILLCSLLFSIGISPILIFLALFIYLFTLTILPYYNILFWTKNIKKVDRFLQNNRRKLLFHYYYALAHESPERQRSLLIAIIHDVEHSNDKHNYLATLFVHDGKYEQALLQAQHIEDDSLRMYTTAYIETLLGNYDVAHRSMQSIKTPWMVSAIAAHIAYNTKKPDAYQRFSNLAIQQSRGLERHLLAYRFSKLTAF